MSSQCEMIKCLVRIDKDVANVLMIATVENGKVKSLGMWIDELLIHVAK